LAVYRLPSPYAQTPVRRRLSGFALALAVNFALLLVLMGLGVVPVPEPKLPRGFVVDLIPDSRDAAKPRAETHVRLEREQRQHPLPKPPAIVLPVKPTIAPPPQPPKTAPPWVEMSHADMAAADIANASPSAGSGSADDTEAVGRGPNGETLYAAEWARRPTDAELSGYLPATAPDGFGLIACKTIPGNRVDDCIELDQEPHGSHLASAVRQAAWQFRVRPPRKNGRPMIGEWVEIRIDYERIGRRGE
jgi:protein TonB